MISVTWHPKLKKPVALGRSLHHLPFAGPAGHLLPYLIEDLFRNDGRVIVLHIHHGALSLVFLYRLADAVGGVGLLQQGVANVFFIDQDVVDHLICPALNPAGSGDLVRLQLRLDLAQAAPVQVAAEDTLYRLRLLRDDLRLTVRPPPVAQQLLVLEGNIPRVTGVFAGITEPILYGLIMTHKRLMVIVAIAGAIGGAIAGAFQVMLTAFVFHNIFSTITMAYSPFIPYLIGILVSFVSGAVMTYLWGIPASERADFEPAVEKTAPVPAVPAMPKAAPGETVLEMRAPLTGEVIPLEQVEDEVFASGVTGLGLAIRPVDGIVLAPCDGEVSMIADSLHAIGLSAAGDAEVLIHVGLNTTMLSGKGFEPLVKKGDTVIAGQPLLKFDMDFITSEGYPLVTPVLIVNAEDFGELEFVLLLKNNLEKRCRKW